MTNSINSEMMCELELCQAAVEKRLGSFFSGDASYGKLLDSMSYSLLAGGKRVRAVICIKFCEASGGTRDSALDAACAIEMLHTYSLIHDDLPCMDNDDMRRGKPSNHVKFGEYTATLAGDALQAAAFNALLCSDLPPGSIVGMARILAEAAGPHGICGGQYLDLSGGSTPTTFDELLEIHSLKTAALISASARIGVLAGGGTPEQIIAADKYAQAVGLAFQVRDDILDVTATPEELGKPIGSDNENNKTTLAAFLGIDECEKMILIETNKAIAALDGKFGNTLFLEWFAKMLAERKS